VAAELGAVPDVDRGAPVTAAVRAFAFEKRFSGRTHVGVVSHLEGWDVPRSSALVLTALQGLGLAVESVADEQDGLPVFHAAAPVTVGEGMELWIVVTEKPRVGCQLELRLFHVLEEAALADEYLARLAGQLAQPRVV